MAERTPRFLWNNLFKLSTTALSASSEQSGAPKTRIRYPFLTDQWRSSIGWDVVNQISQRFTYKEGGNSRTADLGVGGYANGAAYVTAIQTAMNAVAVLNTYAASYSTATHKITINRATGTDTFELPFATGTHAVYGVHFDMGFNATDHTGATTYTAENAAYQSRKWLIADLGSAMSAQGLIVAGHNVGAGTIHLQADDGPDWTAPATNQLLAGTSLRAAFLTNPISRRYLRVAINDVQNPVAFAAVGVAFAGTWFQPDRSYSQGMVEAGGDLSVVSRGPSGAWFQDKRGRGREMKLSFPLLPRSDKDLFDTMMEAIGVGGHLFFAEDPQNYPSTRTYYGVIAADPQFTHGVRDGNPPDGFSVEIPFVQEIQ